MKYIKLNLSFSDKIKLLFLGVISEDKLPVNEVTKEVEKQVYIEQRPNVPVPPPAADINTEEDTFVIPFFDINNEDTKSNF